MTTNSNHTSVSIPQNSSVSRSHYAGHSSEGVYTTAAANDNYENVSKKMMMKLSSGPREASMLSDDVNYSLSKGSCSDDEGAAAHITCSCASI